MFSTFEYENFCFFVAKDSQLPFMLLSKLDAGPKIGRFTPPGPPPLRKPLTDTPEQEQFLLSV